MYTRSSLMSFLKETSEEAQFEIFNYDSPEQFSVIVKCKVEDGRPVDFYTDYAKTWINDFSTFTSTAWIFMTNQPAVANRIAFRKTYVCHRGAQNKSSKSIRYLRTAFCRARVDFKTKVINKDTVRNDDYLLKDLNMTITINFVHTHMVHDLATFNLLKSSAETDAVFYEYFEGGHDAASAKCYHELGLIEKYGRDSAEIANAGLNPDLRHVTHLHAKRWGQNVLDESVVMHKKTTALEKLGHTLKYTDSPRFAVVLTATMKRVIQRSPLEHVLVEDIATSSGVSVMFFFVPTEIGSLPIAGVAYTEQNTSYSKLFLALKLTIECECDKTFQPKIVVLGDLKAKDAIIEVLPEVVVKKSRFSLCRELWEWVCDDDNGIAHRMTQHNVMVMLKTLIYTTSIADAVKIYEAYLTDAALNLCVNKLEEIWSQRNYWLVEESCGDFDNAFPVIIRECVMQRCQSFNMCAMVDLMTNILENQYKSIIQCHVKDGDIKAAYTKLLPKEEVTASSFRQLTDNSNEYLLQGRKTSKKKTVRFYHLNVDSMCCDCTVGVKGSFCEHLCAAVNCVDNGLIKSFSLSKDVKNMFLRLVEGEDVVMKDDIQSEFIGCIEASDGRSIADLSVVVKQEDPLEEPMAMAIPYMTVQYESSLKALNDEFIRLSQLFKDNPSAYNLETMKSLTDKLSKIRPAAMVEVSDLDIIVNNTQ